MRLVRLVRKPGSVGRQKFARLAHDLKLAIPHTLDDVVLHSAATKALLIATAGMYVGGNADFDEFFETHAPYTAAQSAATRAPLVLWERDVLLQELVESYGFRFEGDAMIELIEAACNEERFESDDDAPVNDLTIYLEANRRAALAAQSENAC